LVPRGITPKRCGQYQSSDRNEFHRLREHKIPLSNAREVAEPLVPR
jgi:hypothetical protein